MKKEIYHLFFACLVFTFMAGCAGAGHNQASTSGATGHPALSEQEKLVACSDCHMDVTPDIYKQWFNSRHGLDKVKCFQCHGTFEDMKVSPDETSCAACHNAQFHTTVKGRTCWTCHPEHGFRVHK